MAKKRAADPEAAREKARVLYASNVEHYRRYFREKARLPESKAKAALWERANPQLVAAKHKRYRDRHPERARAARRRWAIASREILNAKVRARYAANPAIWLVHGNTRRVRKMNAPGAGVTAKDWLQILEINDHRCAYCLCRSSALTMDHVIALSRGGSDEPENIVPACASCNSSKHQKSLLEIFEPGLVISQRMVAPLSA